MEPPRHSQLLALLPSQASHEQGLNLSHFQKLLPTSPFSKRGILINKPGTRLARSGRGGQVEGDGEE